MNVAGARSANNIDGSGETVGILSDSFNVDSGAATDELITRLAPWLEREFEMTRENALKTIRTEHKLLELAFDTSNRGPF